MGAAVMRGRHLRVLAAVAIGVVSFVLGVTVYPDIDHRLVGTPYGAGLNVCLALVVLCWMASIVTRDHSWVDRLWSLVPALYCGIVVADVGFGSARITVMTVLACLWGARLTFNLARRGGYRAGSQDYRWTYIQDQLTELQFQLFNVTLVSFIQMAIVWWFTSPIHQAWLHAEVPLGWLDYVAIVAFLTLLVLEGVADGQMWRFQQNKKQLVASGAEVERPFMTEGLFRYCRHPNCACEMGMWVVFNLFAISASGRLWHWTGLGCVILVVLVLGSTQLTEKISSARYPGYSRYQAAVPMFIPNPLNPRPRRAQPVYL